MPDPPFYGGSDISTVHCLCDWISLLFQNSNARIPMPDLTDVPIQRYGKLRGFYNRNYHVLLLPVEFVKNPNQDVI